MTIKDVSEIVGLNWKTVKAIDKHYIREQISSLRDIEPERIGVDEIAYRKGHNYLTVVRDFDLNAVIWIGLNRRKETLDQFFGLLGKTKCKKISVVVTDMHDPYIASVREHCPRADIVFDKFHIIKKINEALDEIRK
jgi:transposase